MITIVIPSYGRAHLIAERVENAKRNTWADNQVVVVVEPEEFGKYSGVVPDGTYLLANSRTKNYAGAVNSAVEEFSSDYYFLAADDLNFHRDWDVHAGNTLRTLPHLRVVGTNDLLNGYVLRGWHATHYLVDRRYLDDPGGIVDGAPGHVLYEGYSHNFTDTEFIGTAKARAVFAPCLESVVEHLHWSAGKSEADSTTDKTNEHLDEDSSLYHDRRHLWWDLSK